VAENKTQQSTQLTFTHLIITALVMLVVGYLFGRFTLGIPGVTGTAGVPGSTGGFATGPDIAALAQAADNSPDDADAWTALGNAYFDTGRHAEAVDAYTRSIQIDAGDPNVWTDRGVMYRRLGNPEKAIEDFNTAAAIDPRHPMSRFNKGIVSYYDLDDLDTALSAFEAVLDIDPNFRTPAGVPLRDFMGTLR
jgi:predicted TPR repeat methyltransferase